jgi:hypothetical protein
MGAIKSAAAEIIPCCEHYNLVTLLSRLIVRRQQNVCFSIVNPHNTQVILSVDEKTFELQIGALELKMDHWSP